MFNRRCISFYFLVLCVLALVACAQAQGVEPQPEVSGALPDAEGDGGVSLPPTPTQWPTPVNQPWRTVAIGVEVRQLPVHEPHFRFPATANMVRLDPTLVKIHSHYSPEVPVTVEEWQRETRAIMVVNGGFFTPARRTEGLMVGFGYEYGLSYREGGMFYMEDGRARIRDLSEEPYSLDEELDEAMQSYPMLVGHGEAVHPYEEFRYNRRTAIGVDDQERVVVVVFDEPVVSLNELSHWLADSDLELEAALNLDGGSSSGLALVTDTEELIIDSGTALPIVIAAYP